MSPVRVAGAAVSVRAAAVLLFADAFEFVLALSAAELVVLPGGRRPGLVALPRPRPSKTAAGGSGRGTRSGDGGRFSGADRRRRAGGFPRTGTATSPSAPVVVVIAAYQEAESLDGSIDAITDSSCGQRLATLVVVDGGNDATAGVAAEHGAYICVARSTVARAPRCDWDYHLARTGGARFIVTTDADDQYDCRNCRCCSNRCSPARPTS